jgi:hypothetical protein
MSRPVVHSHGTKLPWTKGQWRQRGRAMRSDLCWTTCQLGGGEVRKNGRTEPASRGRRVPPERRRGRLSSTTSRNEDYGNSVAPNSGGPGHECHSPARPAVAETKSRLAFIRCASKSTLVAEVQRPTRIMATASVGRGSRLDRMRGGRRRSPGGFAASRRPEAAKDRVGYIGLGDRGDGSTTVATAVTDEDVDGKDLLQELGPWSTVGQPIGTAARWRWEVRGDRGTRAVAQWRVNGMGGPRRGDHGGVRGIANGAASASMGGEQAVVASQMDARRRDKRRQRREEFQRDMTRWVAPSGLVRFMR